MPEPPRPEDKPVLLIPVETRATEPERRRGLALTFFVLSVIVWSYFYVRAIADSSNDPARTPTQEVSPHLLHPPEELSP